VAWVNESASVPQSANKKSEKRSAKESANNEKVIV